MTYSPTSTTLAAADWYHRRTWSVTETSVAGVAAARQRAGASVTVIVPARNEAATVGAVVATLMGLVPDLVDQVIVIDDDSQDGTGRVAREAGAEVHRTSELCPDGHPSAGKGDAMWRGLRRATGDLVLFVDADLIGFTADDVAALLQPLLDEPTVRFVKAFHTPVTVERPVQAGGGRVAELLARPLMHLWWPGLAAVVHPLSGQIAARRELLLELPFVSGYGVELAMLVDTYERYGIDAIAQVGLSALDHRHRDLAALSRTAYAIAQVAALRAGLHGGFPAAYLQTSWREGVELPALDAAHVTDVERPPMIATPRGVCALAS